MIEFWKAFAKTAEFVENISPEVWELTVRQVIIEGWLSIIFFITMAGLSAVCLPKLHASAQDDEDPLWQALGMVALGLATFIATWWLAAIGSGYLLNPEYHAMSRLMGLLPW